jgi:membrane protein
MMWLKWLSKTIFTIGLRTDSDHVFVHAAGIAFNIITSLVPAILLILFALGYVLDSERVVQQLNEYASTYIISEGYQSEILTTLRAQIDVIVANRGITGLIGILGLLWSASALASSIRVAMNAVMRCRETRNFLVYKLYDMVAIMFVGLLIFITIITGPILELLKATSDQLANFLNVELAGFDILIGEGIGVVTTLLLFWIVFRWVPYQRQSRLIIIVGTVTSASLWLGARFAFRYYLNTFGGFSRVYGAYAYFAGAAIWIYFSALVFLIGAEVAYHVKQSGWFARRSFSRLANEE